MQKLVLIKRKRDKLIIKRFNINYVKDGINYRNGINSKDSGPPSRRETDRRISNADDRGGAEDLAD